MSIQARSPVFVAILPTGNIGVTLPAEPAEACRILHRLLPVLPPVLDAHVVPNNTLLEAK